MIGGHFGSVFRVRCNMKRIRPKHDRCAGETQADTSQFTVLKIRVRKVQQWGSIKHDAGKKAVGAYPKPGAGDCPPVIGAYPASG